VEPRPLAGVRTGRERPVERSRERDPPRFAGAPPRPGRGLGPVRSARGQRCGCRRCDPGCPRERRRAPGVPGASGRGSPTPAGPRRGRGDCRLSGSRRLRRAHWARGRPFRWISPLRTWIRSPAMPTTLLIRRRPGRPGWTTRTTSPRRISPTQGQKIWPTIVSPVQMPGSMLPDRMVMGRARNVPDAKRAPKARAGARSRSAAAARARGAAASPLLRSRLAWRQATSASAACHAARVTRAQRQKDAATRPAVTPRAQKSSSRSPEPMRRSPR
jgi:hypothetical protein